MLFMTVKFVSPHLSMSEAEKLTCTHIMDLSGFLFSTYVLADNRRLWSSVATFVNKPATEKGHGSAICEDFARFWFRHFLHVSRLQQRDRLRFELSSRPACADDGLHTFRKSRDVAGTEFTGGAHHVFFFHHRVGGRDNVFFLCLRGGAFLFTGRGGDGFSPGEEPRCRWTHVEFADVVGRVFERRRRMVFDVAIENMERAGNRFSNGHYGGNCIGVSCPARFRHTAMNEISLES